MNTSPSVLPSFSRPPVIEVVCGVQFDRLSSFKAVHFGEFLQRVRHAYPHTEDHPPLAEVFDDRPGTDRPSLLEMDIPFSRVFYIDPSGNFLLQLQPTRFLANWRRMNDSDEYPRFTAAYDRFLNGWDDFVRFCKTNGLGTPQVNQYELTYINHVAEAVEAYPVGIQHILPIVSWRSAQSIHFLPPPRGLSLKVQFALPDDKGSLHVTVNHGERRRDKERVLLLDLTARGPGLKDWSDMNVWFQTAHEWIVRGFTDLTAGIAHDRWGRQQ